MLAKVCHNFLQSSISRDIFCLSGITKALADSIIFKGRLLWIRKRKKS